MGHLFTKMTTLWLEQQITSYTIVNGSKSSQNKRKRNDLDHISNKRKTMSNATITNDGGVGDDEERLSLSPRVSPILPKATKPSHSNNSSLLFTIATFKCQLCRRCFKRKDLYLDHMITCAVQRQVSIKIVRAKKEKSQHSL